MRSAIAAIAHKDLRVLARDRMALFWALGFPVLFGLFFGSIIKVGPGAERAPVRVVLVDTPGRSELAALAQGLRDAGLEVSRAARADARAAVRRARPEPLRAEIVRMLADGSSRTAARDMSAALRGLDSAARFADFVRAVAP